MPGPTYATFGNTTISRGFDFTFGPGVQPSVCMLYTVPHTQTLPAVGTLQFQTVGEQPFVFPDCQLGEPNLSATKSGQYWTLPIRDRRWKWEFAFIHGSHNIPKPDGSILREKTPQELAQLLFTRMDEFGADVSRLPNTTRPERRWEGANAASELDRLCNELSCWVVLNPFTNRAEIWPIGEGLQLPPGDTMGTTYAPVFPAQPERVRVEAGPTLFQAEFTSDPVGLDTDGVWRLIDDLSYKPAGGWGSACIAGGFPEITGTYTQHGKTLNKRDLARSTVFRCYRIDGLRHFGWVPPILEGTPFEPQSLRDFQLFPQLADEEISNEDGGLRRLDAVVDVLNFQVGLGDPPSGTTRRYTGAFSFDTEHGIISFDEPIFRIDNNGKFERGYVWIQCAFHCGRDGIMARAYVESTTGATWQTPTRLVQRDDITARVIYRGDGGGINFTRDDNLADTAARLQYWLDASLAEYGLQEGGTVNYAKLMRISPDGLTQQITWSGGGQREPSTTVSQAQRHNRYVPPLDEYRDRLAARRTEKELAKLFVDLPASMAKMI